MRNFTWSFHFFSLLRKNRKSFSNRLDDFFTASKLQSYFSVKTKKKPKPDKIAYVKRPRNNASTLSSRVVFALSWNNFFGNVEEKQQNSPLTLTTFRLLWDFFSESTIIRVGYYLNQIRNESKLTGSLSSRVAEAKE